MSIFDSFPLMNAYSVNLDWILRKQKELEDYIREYTAINHVAFAGVWDISKGYPQWSVVSNGNDTYMANKPVPVGVGIDNEEYWLHLADLDPRIDGLITELSRVENELNNLTFFVEDVTKHGAVGDGVTDDYDAVRSAIEKVGRGGYIYFPSGQYYLGKDPGADDIHIFMDTGVVFTGPGAGTVNTGAGKFGSTHVSNPWIRVTGNYNNAKLEKVPCPVGGGTYSEAVELEEPLDSSQEIYITATITSGTHRLTNVSNTNGISPGDAIYTDEPINFGDKSSITTVMRVYSVNSDAREIDFGLDNGNGAGALTPTNYTGKSGTYTFIVRKRLWQGLQYAGLNTGVAANPDKWYWLYNGVVNLHNQPAFGVELDFNTWGAPSEMSRCVSLTGIGNTQADAIALEIIRGGVSSWSYALQIANSIVGLDISANQPIHIHASWFNNGKGAVEPIAYGILFDNTDKSHLARPAIACKQLENGAQGITVQRTSDTDPRGSLLCATNAEGSAALFNVDAGGVTTLQRLQLQQNVTAQQNLPATGYLTIMDATGKTYKLLVAE